MDSQNNALAKPIVLRVVAGQQSRNGLSGVILSPENVVLHEHFSSDRDWLRHDLYESPTAKQRLDAIYPEGYQVVWE